MKDNKKIVIVGAGTAGYVTALILKAKFEKTIDITVIKSKDIGIVGVGEGSTEHWKEFLKYTKIKPELMIKECGATFKSGIMFQGWGTKNYLHNVNAEYQYYHGQENLAYLKLMIDDKLLTNKESLNNFISKETVPNQYHFDTFKLNKFLEKTSKERDINIIDDVIEKVVISTKGITSIQSKDKKYTADLFIDCTGFKKVLIKGLRAKWKSYKKYLKVNSAFTFQTPDEENYNLWTLAKAMKFGWRFKIPVQGRHGNGYIFCDKYTNTEKGKLEVEKELGHKITIGKEFKFDPGRLEKVWIKNCVAIGLSANFVEPLEATSIGTSINQAFLLIHNLSNVNQYVRDQYNKQVAGIMDNIRDFIYLHYLSWNRHNWFWKNFTYQNAPPSLTKLLNLWRRRLPIEDDIGGSHYKLFYARNFSHVLYGIDFFYKESLLKQYEDLPFAPKNATEEYLKKVGSSKYDYVTHKQYIEQIKDLI